MAAVHLAIPNPSPRTVRQDLKVSREQLGRLLNVSARTIERWELSDRPPATERQRRDLALLNEIVTLGKIVYRPDGFLLFMRTPIPAFDGNTALQMIESGRPDVVLSALAADYEGLGF